ncbi:LysR family transcriptional regulator [Micrococcus luteus]|nr:LysR family transcriptional regulator [Micrococcus luteus]
MEIRQFEAFLLVAEELHFGRAAERLHLAQPALSRMIRSLERELGTPLFERTTRKVRLTSAGDALLGPAQEIQVQVDGVKRLAKTARGGSIGRVRVGFAGAAGYGIVSTLAREISRRHPGITLQLDPHNFSGEAATALEAGELDLVVLTLPAPPGIEVHLLGQEGLVAAVPSDHHLAGRDSIEVSELRNEPFVSLPATHGSRVRDAMAAACVRAGFSPHVAQEAPDAFSQLALIGAGVGVSIVVESSRKIRMDGVTYLPLSTELPGLPLALGWRESNPSVALDTVVESIRVLFPPA